MSDFSCRELSALAIGAALGVTHWCGNSRSISLARCVGSRVSTSLRHAYGSCPFMRADWIKLMIAAALFHHAAKYYKVTRNFPIDVSESRLQAALDLVRARRGALTEKNVCQTVDRLASEFESRYGKKMRFQRHRNSFGYAIKVPW